MKKLVNLFSMTVIAATVLFSSCSKTTDPTPTTTKTFADSANTYTAKLVGAQNNAAGSYFASSNGTVYLSADAKNNVNIVDVTFAEIGATTTTIQPMLISPDNRDKEGLMAFTGGKTTYFNTSTLNYATVTGAQLAAISTTSTLKSIVIAKGGTYEFVNAAGKKGLINVTDYTPGPTLATGSITINVKVQK